MYLTQHYPDHLKHLHHYDNDPENIDTRKASTLRGHKLYWHPNMQLVSPMNGFKHESGMCGLIAGNFQSDLKLVPSVKINRRFKFEIHFENLHRRIRLVVVGVR